MIRTSQVNYERRLAAVSDDPRAPQLAVTYVDSLRPCYEWEGYHDCPNMRQDLPTNTRQPTRTDRSAHTCLCSRHIAGCAPRKRTTMRNGRRMRNAAGASTSRGFPSLRNRASC